MNYLYSSVIFLSLTLLPLFLATANPSFYPEICGDDFGLPDPIYKTYDGPSKTLLALKGVLRSVGSNFFEELPGDDEKETLIERMKTEGLSLEENLELENGEILTFSWQELHTNTEAKNICRNFVASFPQGFCSPVKWGSGTPWNFMKKIEKVFSGKLLMQ